MPDMSIAHFGTTLIEEPAPAGADQANIPKTGDLARTDRFLELFGAKVYISNMYPGIGRQYIYRRGEFSDPDYFEKDTFTSYTASSVPDAGRPRVGDIIFRLPHRDPVGIAKILTDEEVIQPISDLDAFVSGDADRLLFTGPDQQVYELIQSSDQRWQNHRVYIWTAQKDLEAHKQGYAENFDLVYTESESFQNHATAHLLVRQEPGMTIALLTSNSDDLAPKNSFDIFGDAGYSHFRLGAPDKQKALISSEEAFPDGGGEVSYVHFQNSYLELVQIGTEIKHA